MKDMIEILEPLAWLWLVLSGVDYFLSYYRFFYEALDRGYRNAVDRISPQLAELMYQRGRTLPTKEFHFYMIIRSLVWPWHLMRWLWQRTRIAYGIIIKRPQ